MVEIRNLTFSYQGQQNVLDDVNVRINIGERVAIVGPNGAGKSTLLLHLNGILHGKGQIIIDDLLLEEKTLPIIRSKVGFVFQSPDDQLFSMSVFDDVAFGLIYQGMDMGKIKSKVNRVLEKVGMPGSGERAPYQLSLGEKKRISLATVLVMEPKVLVLDEPTLGLDPKGKRELLELLNQIPDTMIISTHDLDIIPDIFHRLLILNKGKIVYDGSAMKGLADKNLLLCNGLL